MWSLQWIKFVNTSTWINRLIIGIHILVICAPVLDAFDCFFATIFNLKTVDCNDKNYKSIPKGFDHTIQVLEFSDNQLTYLGADEFEPYQSLQEIYLDRNKLDVIFPDAFRNLDNLQLLSLESNRLREIPVESLKHIESVRILKFRGNQITRIEAHSLQSLINIEDINFENNFIEYVDEHAFSGLNFLQEINLVNNELKTLSPAMQMLLPQSLEVFRIYDNPWSCDCQLRWIRQWLSTSEVNWDFAANTPTCDGPELINNVNWKHLNPEQFACAAHIKSNTSTGILQVVLGGNITIECEVYGDPQPRITWMKGNKVINKNGHTRKYTISEVGIKPIKSTLTLKQIESGDITDYKCIARNTAGISEVTYKLIQEGKAPTNPVTDTGFFFGLSKEVVLGIAIAGALVTLILLSIVVTFLCRQQDRRKHAYKVREYRSPSNGDQKQNRAPTDNHASVHKQPNTKVDRHHVTAERKELLSDNKHPDFKPTERSKAGAHNGRSDVTRDADSPFTMKVYATYDRIQDGVTLESSADQGQGPSRVQHRSPTEESRETPDLLKDGGNNMLPSPRAIPVPPPVVPSHLSSCHPRAEENPYVKPSELRNHTMKRKTASADDLLDGVKDEQPEVTRGSRSRDDLDDLARSSQRDVTSPYGTLGRPRHKDHSSTCKNPVCLKDPNLGLETQDYTQRSRVRSPPRFPGAHREIDVDNLNSPESRSGGIPPGDRYGDRYKTLPCRLRDKDYVPSSSMSQYAPISTVESQYTPSSTPVSNPTRTPLQSAQRSSTRNRPPNTKTVSFSEQGHPIIDLTQEMPEPIIISSRAKPLPPTRGDYSTYSTPRSYASPVSHSPVSHSPVAHSPVSHSPMSHGPVSQGPVSHTIRGPENISGVVPSSHKAPLTGIYGTHKAPIPNGSPARRHRQPQSTTLDDLLSPPFGHVPTAQRGIQGSMTLPHKRKTPKPGEKDEFGTAV